VGRKHSPNKLGPLHYELLRHASFEALLRYAAWLGITLPVGNTELGRQALAMAIARTLKRGTHSRR
jgi:hypothetical protein